MVCNNYLFRFADNFSMIIGGDWSSFDFLPWSIISTIPVSRGVIIIRAGFLLRCRLSFFQT